MVRRRVAVLSCALMTFAALAACSHSSVSGESGLVPAGSTSPTVAAGPTATDTSATPTATPGGGHTAKGTNPTTSSQSASAAPDDTDYAFAWSNADCHWFVDANGLASVSAGASITANIHHTTGTVKATVTTNGGGVPTGSETVMAKSLKPGTFSFGYTISAPAADFESHSLTFTGTLTFDGVPDQLAGDNTSSLLIHFPTTFMAGTDGEENLVCDHV